jgi:hypothetical protein
MDEESVQGVPVGTPTTVILRVEPRPPSMTVVGLALMEPVGRVFTVTFPDVPTGLTHPSADCC